MDRTEGSKRIVSILMDKNITEWRDVLVRMMDECRRQIEEIDAQAERVEFDNITSILVWIGAKKTHNDLPITMDGIGMLRPDWPTSIRFGGAYPSDTLVMGRHPERVYYKIYGDIDISKLHEFITRDDHVRLVIDEEGRKVWYTIIGDLFFVTKSIRRVVGWTYDSKWTHSEVSVMTKERLIHVSSLKVDREGKRTLTIKYPLGSDSSGTITITNDDDIAEIKNWTLL